MSDFGGQGVEFAKLFASISADTTKFEAAMRKLSDITQTSFQRLEAQQNAYARREGEIINASVSRQERIRRDAEDRINQVVRRAVAERITIERAAEAEREILIKRDERLREEEIAREDALRRNARERAAAYDQGMLQSRTRIVNATENLEKQLTAVVEREALKQRDFKEAAANRALKQQQANQAKLLADQAAFEKQAQALEEKRLADQLAADRRIMAERAKMRERDLAAAEAEARAQEAATHRSLGILGGSMHRRGLLQTAGNEMVFGGGALEAGLVGMVALGDKYERKIQEIATNTNLANNELKVAHDGILKVAEDLGGALDQHADAFMRVHNFGFAAAEALKIEEVAARRAIPANADISQAADLLAGNMRKYHLTLDQASRAQDVMTLAIARGDTTMKDFSRATATVLSLGAAQHQPFEQMNAALSALTLNTHNVFRAQTLLQNILLSIESPVERVRKAIRGLAPEWRDLFTEDFSRKGLADKGLLKILEDIQRFRMETRQPIELLFNARRGGMGADFLTDANFDTFIRNAKDFTDATKNVAGQALIAQESEQSLARQTERLQATFVETSDAARRALLPAFTAILDHVKGLLDTFNHLSPAEQNATFQFVALGGALLIGTGLVLKITSALIKFYEIWVELSKAQFVSNFVSKLSGLNATSVSWLSSSERAAALFKGALAGIVEFMSGPLGIAIAALGVAWATNLGGMRKDTASAFQSMEDGLGTTVNALLTNWRSFLNSLVGETQTADNKIVLAHNAMGQALTAEDDETLRRMSRGWMSFSDYLGYLFVGIKNTFITGFKDLVAGLIQTVATAIDVLRGFASAAASAVKSVFTLDPHYRDVQLSQGTATMHGIPGLVQSRIDQLENARQINEEDYHASLVEKYNDMVSQYVRAKPEVPALPPATLTPHTPAVPPAEQIQDKEKSGKSAHDKYEREVREGEKLYADKMAEFTQDEDGQAVRRAQDELQRMATLHVAHDKILKLQGIINQTIAIRRQIHALERRHEMQQRYLQAEDAEADGNAIATAAQKYHEAVVEQEYELKKAQLESRLPNYQGASVGSIAKSSGAALKQAEDNLEVAKRQHADEQEAIGYRLGFSGIQHRINYLTGEQQGATHDKEFEDRAKEIDDLNQKLVELQHTLGDISDEQYLGKFLQRFKDAAPGTEQVTERFEALRSAAEKLRSEMMSKAQRGEVSEGVVVAGLTSQRDMFSRLGQPGQAVASELDATLQEYVRKYQETLTELGEITKTDQTLSLLTQLSQQRADGSTAGQRLETLKNLKSAVESILQTQRDSYSANETGVGAYLTLLDQEITRLTGVKGLEGDLLKLRRERHAVDLAATEATAGVQRQGADAGISMLRLQGSPKSLAEADIAGVNQRLDDEIRRLEENKNKYKLTAEQLKAVEDSLRQAANAQNTQTRVNQANQERSLQDQQFEFIVANSAKQFDAVRDYYARRVLEAQEALKRETDVTSAEYQERLRAFNDYAQKFRSAQADLVNQRMERVAPITGAVEGLFNKQTQQSFSGLAKSGPVGEAVASAGSEYLQRGFKEAFEGSIAKIFGKSLADPAKVLEHQMAIDAATRLSIAATALQASAGVHVGAAGAHIGAASAHVGAAGALTGSAGSLDAAAAQVGASSAGGGMGGLGSIFSGPWGIVASLGVGFVASQLLGHGSSTPYQGPTTPMSNTHFNSHLHIDRFYNNSNQDVQDLSETLAWNTKQRLSTRPS